jgi:hypothetical protein
MANKIPLLYFRYYITYIFLIGINKHKKKCEILICYFKMCNNRELLKQSFSVLQ